MSAPVIRNSTPMSKLAMIVVWHKAVTPLTSRSSSTFAPMKILHVYDPSILALTIVVSSASSVHSSKVTSVTSSFFATSTQIANITSAISFISSGVSTPSLAASTQIFASQSESPVGVVTSSQVASIVGGVIGSVAGIILIFFSIAFAYRHHKMASQMHKASSGRAETLIDPSIEEGEDKTMDLDEIPSGALRYFNEERVGTASV